MNLNLTSNSHRIFVFIFFIVEFYFFFVDDDFLNNTSVAYKIWYLMISTMMVRFKYYYAWLFADAICNNSGLGRNGWTPDGSPRWDLISNVDIIPFEVFVLRYYLRIYYSLLLNPFFCFRRLR